MVAPDRRLGPAELVLATSVARRYYLDGRTKVEIADEFQLSRFKIARLLDSARSQGLVRIEVGHPGRVNIELSEQLRDTFHLQHAVVLDAADDHEASLRQQLGQTAAELLTEITTPDDVLGLAWARAVGAMATQLQSLPPVPVVQLTRTPSTSSARSLESPGALPTCSSPRSSCTTPPRPRPCGSSPTSPGRWSRSRR
jgi:DNA-binding transcriptional regulator LsrR (DeoR family)